MRSAVPVLKGTCTWSMKTAVPILEGIRSAVPVLEGIRSAVTVLEGKDQLCLY